MKVLDFSEAEIFLDTLAEVVFSFELSFITVPDIFTCSKTVLFKLLMSPEQPSGEGSIKRQSPRNKIKN